MSKKNTKITKPTLKDRLRALRYLRPFLKEVWQTQPIYTATNILLRLLRSTTPAATLYVGKLIIDEITKAFQQQPVDKNYLILLIAGELALNLTADVLNRFITLFDTMLGDLHSNSSSIKIMKHAARLDLAQFEQPIFYDKLDRARQQTTGRTVLLAQSLTQLQDLITVAFLGAALLFFNPWLVLIFVLSIVPSFIGEIYFNAKNYELNYRWTPQRRELDYLRYVGASNGHAKEVKLFNLSSFLINRFQGVSHSYYLQNRDLSIQRNGWGAVLAAIGTVGYYTAYVLVALSAVSGAIGIGSLTFLTASFIRMRSLLEGILSRFVSISQTALYLKDYFEFFEIQPRIVSPVAPLPFPNPIQRGFEFENVGFCYPDKSKWVFKNLNFTLHAGEKLAIVGENGAGKTTLVKLLSRLYEPTEGRIMLDGHDLADYNLTDLQYNIGVIFQDYIKLMMTAQANIAVGDIDQIDNLERITTASERSLANKLIERFPAGLSQMLGHHFGNGTELSGGEWQKIALARAYMRDAQLLILDEPTAALDARAEYEVFRRFADLTKGKMAVLISHRFSTVRMADRILVIEKGELLESGSHEALMAQNGHYAELFQLQARGYV